jgi:ABC-type multidrug transport system fused ATPase/permease subunit
VFSHTTSRIDVELGARLFRHLVQLPLAYFQARRVGDSVARVRELENIRSFLTGNALTAGAGRGVLGGLRRGDAALQRAADAGRAGQPAAVCGC